jgi:hypothetical protein
MSEHILMKFSQPLLALFLVLSSLSMNVYAQEKAKELYWEDLIPKDFTMPPVSMDHAGSMAQVAPNAPLIESLDGTLAKIPGFVVPLEGDAESITEFLLVPYFGACVHVPPPPSNQIVYVKFAEGVPVTNLYDAVWVIGTLSTEGWKGDIASVGYSMTGISLLPFED